MNIDLLDPDEKAIARKGCVAVLVMYILALAAVAAFVTGAVWVIATIIHSVFS